jgi:hypothetical protein
LPPAKPVKVSIADETVHITVSVVISEFGLIINQAILD